MFVKYLLVSTLAIAAVSTGFLIFKDSPSTPGYMGLGVSSKRAEQSPTLPTREPVQPPLEKSDDNAVQVDAGTDARHIRAAELRLFRARMRESVALYRRHERNASKQISPSDAVTLARFMRSCANVPSDYGEFAEWALDRYPHDRVLADEVFELCDGVETNLTHAARVVTDAAVLGSKSAKLAYVDFYLDAIDDSGLTREQAQIYVNELLADESPEFYVAALSMNALLNEDMPLEFYASINALLELARELDFDIRDFAFERGNASGDWSLLYESRELEDVLVNFERSASTDELQSARSRTKDLLAQVSGPDADDG